MGIGRIGRRICIMAAPVISIGAQSYEFLINNKCFFVDKTDLIKEWWENQDAVTLITRPRRFGKTLNLNMLECFFSTNYAERNDLFEGFSIWKTEKYRSLQGTYPVIFLSFASVKGTTYKTVREGIIRSIYGAYRNHSYLREGNILRQEEKSYIDSLEKYVMDASPSKTIPDDLVTGSLNELSLYLSRHFGKKVLILLDEYDTPLQEAYANGFWDELVDFIRSLFNAAFKTNPYMERGLMTGITRVSRESIFSDLNNLTVVTTTSEKYRTRFGFTEEEVFLALNQFGMSSEKENVKAWYNGFTFGSQKNIYNPWSITGFLEEKMYKPYWTNSSANRLVSTLIRRSNPQIKMAVEDLMAGKTLSTELDEEIVFNQLVKKRGAIWSLLLASGYLRIVEKVFHPESGLFTYVLALTNKEVSIMFRSMIRDWFSDDQIPYSSFLQVLLTDDVEYMNEYMNQVAKLTFSSFDTGTKPSEDANPERFYHGFVLGLIVELSGKYHIRSNRESGFGRYDVMLEPVDHRQKAYVLEFKVRNPRKEPTLEDTLQAALVQIKDKAYDTDLIARGIPTGQIRHYGFAFEGKIVLIG